jgi:hypothetical protein
MVSTKWPAHLNRHLLIIAVTNSSALSRQQKFLVKSLKSPRKIKPNKKNLNPSNHKSSNHVYYSNSSTNRVARLKNRTPS